MDPLSLSVLFCREDSQATEEECRLCLHNNTDDGFVGYHYDPAFSLVNAPLAATQGESNISVTKGIQFSTGVRNEVAAGIMWRFETTQSH